MESIFKAIQSELPLLSANRVKMMDETNSGKRSADNSVSYSRFLGSLASGIAAGAGILLYITFWSGWIRQSDSPTPVQFLIVNLFSLLVLGVVIFQAFVYWKQWKAMRDVISQNDDVLTKMAEQSAVLERQANSSMAQSAMMRESITLAKEQQGLARKAQKFTETSFYRAERAYLAVRDAAPAVGMGPERQLEFGYIIENGGRTPAFEVSATMYTAISEATDPVEWRRSAKSFFTTDFIMPSKSTERVGGDAFHKLDEQQFRMWEVQRLHYYMKVELRYWDISGSEESRSEYVFNIHPISGAVLTALGSNTMPHRTKLLAASSAESPE